MGIRHLCPRPLAWLRLIVRGGRFLVLLLSLVLTLVLRAQANPCAHQHERQHQTRRDAPLRSRRERRPGRRSRLENSTTLQTPSEENQATRPEKKAPENHRRS